jgi:hypothetical protein
MFKPVKREILTGPEAVERIEAKAKAELPGVSAAVSDALENCLQHIEDPNSSKAKIANSAKQLHIANVRLSAVHNVVSFFVLLDEESHFGSEELRK